MNSVAARNLVALRAGHFVKINFGDIHSARVTIEYGLEHFQMRFKLGFPRHWDLLFGEKLEGAAIMPSTSSINCRFRSYLSGQISQRMFKKVPVYEIRFAPSPSGDYWEGE